MEKKPPSTESLIYEARAKVTWGEPVHEVREWLLEQGLDSRMMSGASYHGSLSDMGSGWL